ncbi:PrsW family glutamic-type intramembrane protease [Leptolyngbya sp. FACHB-17]|uniref:PrsW family glutamic-type intramembrane protease n=1 Tax=unclassified Leptolyngbya TaxID=2650499 RepID=UPI00168188A7|nr:PrsW family glutamic-type intramembrane protease [Leptolyngbya sp. FACHB-17]MBD2079234.1 PrsW family intramembrane metalloprotease [Leptolyngbya sp. FACHB-17]
MTGEISPIACLRQLSIDDPADPKLLVHSLPIDAVIAIGRDPRCQIVVDPLRFASVSRRHAEVRPSEPNAGERPAWWICDLNSSNGTYLNGQQLRGCQLLQSGDRVSLGNDGPEYIFEYLVEFNREVAVATQQEAISPSLTPADSVTLTQLFPIVSTGRELTHKAFLVPSVVTIVFVVGLFVAVGQPLLFNRLLAGYIALVGFYFVYRLCGKRKPWWVMALSAMGTYFLLRSPVLPLFVALFREVLPGQVPTPGEPINPLMLFIRMFFGAGLMEELLKALPLGALFLLGRVLPAPWNDRVGIREPLDGILLGAASAVGFTLIETLGQYVPDMIQTTSLQLGTGWDQLRGLQVLIPRLLGATAGHMAYSGYFGYFIGLAVLKSRQSWLILLIGYLTASGLHALWNVMGSVSEILLALVGMVSYAFLAAAILKARSISPTRSQNFATRLKS